MKRNVGLQLLSITPSLSFFFSLSLCLCVDLNVPDNYRGISLLNICSKLYSFVFNKQITKWIDDDEIIGEEQAGFREDHSTSDHIFTLLALIQTQLLRHSMWLSLIFVKLWIQYVEPNYEIYCIEMASGVKLLLHCKVCMLLSELEFVLVVSYQMSFLCPRGLKQGEVCSPVLFSLFINELTKDIIENGKHGIQLSPDLIELLILLFADDVLFSGSG